MYLKQAWAKTLTPKTGIKRFDTTTRIGIGNVCTSTQNSHYIGTAIAKNYNRNETLTTISKSGEIEQDWFDYIISKPDSEFNLHKFFYPSTNGFLPFYKCLIEHSSKSLDKPKTVFEHKFGTRALGYVKSTVACRSVNESLMKLHIECTKVESAARLFSKDASMKGIISKRIKENRARLYFDLDDVDDCLLILEQNGWDSSKIFRETISKM